MNIQGLNPMSFLAASDASSATAGLLDNEAGAGLFSATFLEQLAQLQQNLLNSSAAGNPGLAEFQQFSHLGGDALHGQNVQELTALFGKDLPTATKLNKDIDLEDTMQALADVLQYLQSLESQSAGQNLSALSSASDKQEGSTTTDLKNAEQQAADMAILAQVQAQSGSQVLPTTQDSNALNEVLKTAVATSEAMSAIKKSPEMLGMDAKKETSAALKGATEGSGNGAAQAGVAKALTAEEQASKQFAQDDSAKNFSTEPGDVLKNPLDRSDAENGLGRMTTDIAQMNKSVNNLGPASAPTLEKHLTHPQWNAELGEKLLWMHKQAVPSAEIRLNPEHLGPISVKIDVNQDQASVVFTAQHAAVRDAIEAAIPKLREMLGGQNLNLADVNVSQQQSEHKQRQDFFQAANEQNRGHSRQGESANDPAASDTSNTILEEIEAGRAIATNGLLSLFA